jgi:hypothetical protein
VPSHDRVGLDDDSRAEQRRHKTIEPDEEQSVRRREPWLGAKPAAQQVQLMEQEDNLGLQPRLRLERRRQYMLQKPRNESIPPRLPDLPVHYRVDSVFGSDTYPKERQLYNEVIEAFPADRTDQSLRMPILPG